MTDTPHPLQQLVSAFRVAAQRHLPDFRIGEPQDNVGSAMVAPALRFESFADSLSSLEDLRMAVGDRDVRRFLNALKLAERANYEDLNQAITSPINQLSEWHSFFADHGEPEIYSLTSTYGIGGSLWEPKKPSPGIIAQLPNNLRILADDYAGLIKEFEITADSLEDFIANHRQITKQPPRPLTEKVATSANTNGEHKKSSLLKGETRGRKKSGGKREKDLAKDIYKKWLFKKGGKGVWLELGEEFKLRIDENLYEIHTGRRPDFFTDAQRAARAKQLSERVRKQKGRNRPT